MLTLPRLFMFIYVTTMNVKTSKSYYLIIHDNGFPDNKIRILRHTYNHT